ncbi:related to mannosylphosphorylation protein MNN4 [Rhynchosporium secalis]|uniref:Related to mannosylphosphorylation protein MNN4 n=1 Tax=Rhynchosporium secalis TaxID=38038 RepID=A0A1E1MIH0_RHYSE|nr:related to mannosylphosphorylation protein MNN4 [Rhynchosporium secalis]
MKIQHLLTKSLLLISTLALPAPNADKLRRISNSVIQRRHNEATPPPDGKYFHEPGGGDDLGHYDIRYFNGKPVSYEERGETLYHLIRSYLSVFRERNIETWIAHGTLLGWWWNGKIMPWDWDLDTQVSGSTLAWLGQNMNMTMHNFTMSEPDGTPMFREYLLDVNPYSAERVRGDGQNVIDARWIDVRNGLFIDITGLSETNPSAQPGVWSCKNYHRYRTRDLYPLRETVYEGVPALVPYSFDRILTEEYSARALTKTKHEGHLWVPEQKEWIRQDVLQQNSEVHGRDVPHIPRRLQADEKPRAGLANLLRIL